MDGITSPPMGQVSIRNSFFSPLLISMLGIVVTSTAIIAYHLLLVKYCIRRHASDSPTAAQPAQPSTGVDEKVLKTIPILTFSAVKDDNRNQSVECVVCLRELEDEDIVRLLPNCKHAFHVACIDQWFEAHTSCPLCRNPINRQTNAAQLSLHLDCSRNDSNRGENNECNATNDSRPELPREQMQSSGLLPSPMERRSWSRLKRSLSMDQLFVAINLQIENCWDDSSSGRGMLSRSGSYGARSMSRFDGVSTRWLRSFSSRLRMGKGSNFSNASILPY